MTLPALWGLLPLPSLSRPCRELGLHSYGSLQAHHRPLLLLRSSRHLFLSFTLYLQRLWHLTWAMCPDLAHDAHLPGEASPEPAPALLASLPGVNLSKKHPFRGPPHHPTHCVHLPGPSGLPCPTITTTRSPLLRPPVIPPVPSPPVPQPSHTTFRPSDFLPPETGTFLMVSAFWMESLPMALTHLNLPLSPKLSCLLSLLSWLLTDEESYHSMLNGPATKSF